MDCTKIDAAWKCPPPCATKHSVYMRECPNCHAARPADALTAQEAVEVLAVQFDPDAALGLLQWMVGMEKYTDEISVLFGLLDEWLSKGGRRPKTWDCPHE